MKAISQNQPRCSKSGQRRCLVMEGWRERTVTVHVGNVVAAAHRWDGRSSGGRGG